METRNCQNCKNDFYIDLEDFAFYTNRRVPPPTFCFDCRLQRRLVFRNERGLYKAFCDNCGQKTPSVVPNSTGKKVYCNSCFVSDTWDARDYGASYDFAVPFFEQFKKLLHVVPVRALTTSSGTLVDCDYCNTSSHLKNCYLVHGSDNSEDSMYSTELFRGSRNCIDSMQMIGVTNAYGCMKCERSNNIRFSMDCKDSYDLLYCKNLSGCSDCLGSANLKNKKYCLWNVQLSKEEYFQKLAEYDLGSYKVHKEILEKAAKHFQNFPVKYMNGHTNSDVSGDSIFQSKNCKYSFIVSGGENCTYCYNLVVTSTTDSMDYSDWGAKASRIYESQSCGANIQDLKFCFFVTKNSMACEYSAHCSNCQYLFGCVGLRNKEYCIFNVQYTKEDYAVEVEKIKRHMEDMPYRDNVGNIYRYGEFFPAELSLYFYNDTTAQNVYTLTKSEAEVKGFLWSEKKENISHDTDIYLSSALPDTLCGEVEDFIEVPISCAHTKLSETHPYCLGEYLITKREYSWYREGNFPLPRACYNCRYFERLAQSMLPPKLWTRTCTCDQTGHDHSAVCPNKIETAYAPERSERVYCESCYQKVMV